MTSMVGRSSRAPRSGWGTKLNPHQNKIEANVNQASPEVVENDLATDLQRNNRRVGYRTCPNGTTQCGTNQQSGGHPTLGRGHQCSGSNLKLFLRYQLEFQECTGFTRAWTNVKSYVPSMNGKRYASVASECTHL